MVQICSFFIRKVVKFHLMFKKMYQKTIFLQYERIVLLYVKYISYLCSVKKEKVTTTVIGKDPFRQVS